MNHSVDPCDNFYEYSCGGMQTDYSMDDDNHLNKLIEMIHNIKKNDTDYLKMYKTFYDSCIQFTEEFNYKERVDNRKLII